MSVKFKEGDLVRVVKGSNLADLKWFLGRIAVPKVPDAGSNTIGVIFPEWEGGHDLSPDLKDYNGCGGWYLDKTELKKVK